MNTQPEALRLADFLEGSATIPSDKIKAAAELRRLHEENERLKATPPNLATPLVAPVQEPVADRVRECAQRLVEHADFRLVGILSSSSKTKEIPSNAASQVKTRHLAALRDALLAAQPASHTPTAAQRQSARSAWVGLTGQQKNLIARISFDVFDAIHRTEAKLKEKNA
jgi:hypothetical protein